MKSFRENVPSRIGFSEEQGSSDVSARVANLDARRSNRTEEPHFAERPSFSEADSGHDNRDSANSRRGKPRIGSFESLVGGIQDCRGSPNSSLFCSQARMNSVRYSDSLQLNCTEGLGFESSDEREDSVSIGSDHSTASSPRPGNNNNNHNSRNREADGDRSGDLGPQGSRAMEERRVSRGFQRSTRCPTGSFPPPLPSIARNGQPWIILRSFRTDGRFVLQEVKTPPHEILHAWRKDGRLRLQLVHREDEGLPPRPDDGTSSDDADDATEPVENEKMIADVAGAEIDGSDAPSDVLR